MADALRDRIKATREEGVAEKNAPALTHTISGSIHSIREHHSQKGQVVVTVHQTPANTPNKKEQATVGGIAEPMPESHDLTVPAGTVKGYAVGDDVELTHSLKKIKGKPPAPGK